MSEITWDVAALYWAVLAVICVALYRLTPRKLPEPKPPRPASPCGNDAEHYYWVVEEGWPCPLCAAIKRRKRVLAEEDRKMRKLAKIIVDEQESRNAQH